MSPLEPLRTDDRAAIGVGMAMWALGLLATLVFRAKLAESGRDWWTWVCVAGLGLGALGLAYVHRRHTRGERSD